LKNNSKKQGSFLGLLVRNYIYFTLAIATVLLLLFAMFTIISDKTYIEAKLEKLPKQINRLHSEQYKKIDAQRLFGRDGYFEILNEEGTIIYKSKVSKRTAYTSGELECIADYDLNSNMILTEYKTKKGETNYLIQYIKDYEAGYEDIGFLILDANYQVIFDNMDTNHKSFTKEEIELLDLRKYDVRKLAFTTLDGEKNTMVMYANYLDYESWEKASQLMMLIIPIFIMCYVVMIVAFVLLLNKKIKIPLMMLNAAMLDFAEEKHKGEICYNGPKEFVQICESFNKMSSLLIESEKEKEKLAIDKQKMLADISHDLKTPITVIKGYSKAICDGIIIQESKKDQYIKTIYQKADGLTELINTFYEFNKLEHPDFHLDFQTKDICEEIREYLAIKYEEIDNNKFLLEADIPEERIMVSFDSLQMRRVYDNILGNALKHNKKGTTIFFQLKKQHDWIVLRIADDGVGIPKGMEDCIFDPFVVGDDSRNNKHGSGLGLAIVDRVIRAHKGTIRLIIPPKKKYKTEFEIVLPMEQ